MKHMRRTRKARLVLYSFALEVNVNGFCAETSATHLSFQGMTSEMRIGNYWLSENHELVRVSFDGLRDLREVKYRWMAGCRLVSVDFKGLKSLRIVGDDWMKGCRMLTTVNYKKKMLRVSKI